MKKKQKQIHLNTEWSQTCSTAPPFIDIEQTCLIEWTEIHSEHSEL